MQTGEKKEHNPEVISRYYGLNFRQLQNTYSFLKADPGCFHPVKSPSLSRSLQVKVKSSQVLGQTAFKGGWRYKGHPVALKPELKDRQSHWFLCGDA